MSDLDFAAIDIGRSTIKLTQIQRDTNSAVLIALGSIDFPRTIESAIPTPDKQENMQLVASTIRSLVEASGLKTRRIVASIPESVVFSKLLSGLPYPDAAKLEETIYWEAKQFIPIPIEQAQTDWIEIKSYTNKEGKQFAEVMFVAAPRELVQTYIQLYEMAELELIALEVESVAMTRAINYNVDDLTGEHMIVEIGQDETDVCVLHEGKMVFSQSIATGSLAFTKAIATDFGLKMNQAEVYKEKYGMRTDLEDKGKIMSSIRPILDILLNEINKIQGFVQSRLNFGRCKTAHFCGNGAMMPALLPYATQALALPCLFLNPFEKVRQEGVFANVSQEIFTPGYAVAAGLALKDE